MAIQPETKHPFLLYAAAGFFCLYLLYSQITLYLSRRRIIRQNGCQPLVHRINKDPFFGLDVIAENRKLGSEKRFLPCAEQRFYRLGVWTYGSRIFGESFVVTAEPENIKTVLSTKFKDFTLGVREHYFKSLLGHGIFNSDGEKWANSRHLLRPNFAKDQLADLEAFERHMKLMLKAIPKDGSTVDLQELFFRLTIDSATEFLFGHSTNSLKYMDVDDENNEDTIFAKAFNEAQHEIVQNVRLGGLSFFRSQKRAKHVNRICHEYVDKFVDDAIRSRERRDLEKDAAMKQTKYVFSHELAKQTTDKKALRDELINILLAGRDTTASLLSNMFFEISKKPYIWAKLREEVAQLEGRLPTYEELRNLKYLKWCLNESLRLHPVVPGNSRLAIRDTVLPLGGGPTGKSPLFIPKGTVVGYSPYTMHRRTDFYGPDATAFKPERWEHLRPGWEFLPFNGGPRICLGQQYALTEASYVTCRLVQEFKGCESRSEGGWVEQLTLTVASDKGAKVSLTPA
ncbi:cytochrome P450 [Delitschia confertaspora ATCC 74209]|uniref:Cytochrome P450 n=1 Tax=Delitschia confertaspora ATCC 74209 TaxID=1513339 RepID=A0A9P4JTC1_9PLEO|nr:cytochrome P450 [Delitschia confertaspora ATCC 74209]